MRSTLLPDALNSLGLHTVSCYAFLTICFAWVSLMTLQIPGRQDYGFSFLCVWHIPIPKEGQHSRFLRPWPRHTQSFTSPLAEIHSGVSNNNL